MFTAFVVVTLLAAAANAYAATVDFVPPRWLLTNMADLGIPRSWLFPLGLTKAVGALGLLVGIAVPLIGVAAAVGLVLYFVGAVGTVVWAQRWEQLPYPLVFLALAAGAFALAVAS